MIPPDLAGHPLNGLASFDGLAWVHGLISNE
jgi:hypothetical protein